MSMHKKPLTPLEESGLKGHNLPIGVPSQLSDVFRHGVAWALANYPSDAVVKLSTLRNEVFEVLQILAMCGGSINADDLGKKLEVALNSTLLEPYPTIESYENELAEKFIDAEPNALQPKLAVWYGSLPESNGKANWTAVLHRADDKDFEIFTDGITIDRSEYPDRVRYEADCVRWLIGELKEKPSLLDYDGDKHSGYIYPSDSVVSVVPKHGQECFIGERPVGQFVGIKPESTSFVTFKNGEFRSYHPEQLGFKRPDTSTPPNAEQINSNDINFDDHFRVEGIGIDKPNSVERIKVFTVTGMPYHNAPMVPGGMDTEQANAWFDRYSDNRKSSRTPEQPTELEMHRAGYQACKEAGFESPSELLAAYKRSVEQPDSAVPKTFTLDELRKRSASYCDNLITFDSNVLLQFINTLHTSPELEPVEGDLLPCPFCGETPDLPDGNGTQYEMSCECGRACSTVQISDLLTVDERASSTFTNYRYEQKYIDRARGYVIAQWNARTNES